MLRKEAVSQNLVDIIVTLQQLPEMRNYRLVGGTSLALQLGHRLSVDVDLFTYGEFIDELVTPAILRAFKDARPDKFSNN